MKTSTEIGSLAKIVGEEKAIETIAKAGFDCWDFTLIYNMVRYDWQSKSCCYPDTPLNGKDGIAYVRRLKRIGEDNGIYCNQSHAPFPVSVKGIKDELKRAIEFSAEAGSKIIIIHPDNNKTAEENAETYFELLPFAKDCGIKIATENMWNWDTEQGHAKKAACSDGEDFLKHILAVNDENFVACVDIGHAEMKGLNTSAESMIKTLGSHVAALHIHDNDKLRDLHELPFTDKIDFGGIVKALKDVDYKGYFTLEADSYLKKEDGEKTIFEKVKNMASVAKRIEDEFLSL